MIICAGNFQIFGNLFIFKKKSVKIQEIRVLKKLKKIKLRLSVSSVQLLFNLWQYIYLFVFIPMCLIKIDVQPKKNCFANRGNPYQKYVLNLWYLIYFMSLIP